MAVAEKAKIGAKRQLTLPKAVLSKFGLDEGDYLELRVLDDRIELVPLALVPRSQAWFWTPEWQAKEAKAEKARRSGDYTDNESADEAIADLDS